MSIRVAARGPIQFLSAIESDLFSGFLAEFCISLGVIVQESIVQVRTALGL